MYSSLLLSHGIDTSIVQLNAAIKKYSATDPKTTSTKDTVAKTASWLQGRYPRISIQAVRNIKYDHAFHLLLPFLSNDEKQTIHKKTRKELSSDLEHKVMAGLISTERFWKIVGLEKQSEESEKKSKAGSRPKGAGPEMQNMAETKKIDESRTANNKEKTTLENQVTLTSSAKRETGLEAAAAKDNDNLPGLPAPFNPPYYSKREAVAILSQNKKLRPKLMEEMLKRKLVPSSKTRSFMLLNLKKDGKPIQDTPWVTRSNDALKVTSDDHDDGMKLRKSGHDGNNGVLPKPCEYRGCVMSLTLLFSSLLFFHMMWSAWKTIYQFSR